MLAQTFICDPTLCARAVKALARLRICVGSPESSLIAIATLAKNPMYWPTYSRDDSNEHINKHNHGEIKISHTLQKENLSSEHCRN